MAASLKALKGSKALTARPARAGVRARAPATVVCSANRTTWLPNLTPPAHLKGTMVGDFGFDPLGLGQDADRLKW